MILQQCKHLQVEILEDPRVHGPAHGVRTAILSYMLMSAKTDIPIHVANKTFFLDLRKSSGYAEIQGLFVLKYFIF